MKKVGVLAVFFAIFGLSTAQVKVGDATLPKEVTFNNENLVINGAGIREKFFFDIYAGGLYLKQKTSDPASIINADETMAIKLDILSGMMSRNKMEGALRDGFKKSTNNNTASIDTRINQFVGFIKEEIEVGQVYDIVYEKGKGSILYKNGKERGVIEGLDFKKALFGIWLGKKPADKDLKKNMLGE